MKSTRPRKHHGFTLVELLVVIVIVGALAALALTIAPKMMAKAKATEAMQSIRQIGPALTTYASDNSMKLPAVAADVLGADGVSTKKQWNEVCLAMLYPDTDPLQFKTKPWWEKNKSFLRNPMFKENARPRGWAPLNPGFAFNEMLAVNILKAQQADGSGTGTDTDPLAYSVSLASLFEPERTPLIASYDDYHFRYDDVQLAATKSGTVKDLMMDGKIPVLFVDGHIETIVPLEYSQRKLSEMPRTAKEASGG